MRAARRFAQAGTLVPFLLVLLSLVPAIAGVGKVATLVAGQPSAADARFVDAPVPVVLHILAVVPFSILGAFQFSSAWRRGGWHRVVGRWLAPLGLVGALTGMWMAHSYPWPAGDGVALYVMRLVVGVAMTGSIILGVEAVVRRDFSAHGAWMIRAYALGMGAGTQVLTHLPWFILVGTPGETSRAFLMGGAWLINGIVAEAAIRRQAAPVQIAESAPARRVRAGDPRGAASAAQ